MPALAFPLVSAFDEGGTPEDDLNNISKLLTALCRTGIQPLETCLQQLLTQRSIETAIGTNLDVIGALVGQGREGLDDETYRRYCRANISAHRSKGTVEDLIKVIDLVVFDDAATYWVAPQPVATVIVTVQGIGITDALALTVFKFLYRTAAAGVRLILEYGNVAPLFEFDVGPGFDLGHLAGSIEH